MSKDADPKQTPGILVNRVDFKLNEVKFDRKYVILHAEYAQFEVRKRAVRILSDYGTVKSIRYEFGGTSFYILLEGRSEVEEIKKKLKSIVLDEPIDEPKYKDIPQDILLDLLLNGLTHHVVSAEDSDYEDDDVKPEPLSYSNLDGGLFTFEPEDVHDEDRIVTLSIKARPSKDCVDLFGKTQILYPAQSFAYVSKMNDNEADKKYLRTLPRYDIYDNRYLKLATGTEFNPSKKMVVKHGYRKMPPARIEFLMTGSPADLDKSKMGRVRRTLRNLRKEYDDIDLQIDFVRTYLFDDNKYSKRGKSFDEFLSDLWKGQTIYLVNKANVPSSVCIGEGLRILLRTKYDINLVDSPEVVPDSYNIVIVKKKIRDPEHKYYRDAMVQHISVQEYAGMFYRKEEGKQEELFEKFGKGEMVNRVKSALVVVLSDLIIKNDVIHNTQTYFPWFQKHILEAEPVGSLDRKWYFYDRVRIENKDPEHRMEATFSDTMACVEMDTDGSMNFSLIKKTDITDDFHMKLIWDQFNKNQSSIKGVLSDGENTYVFLPTDVAMLPETDLIRDRLMQNKQELKDNVEGASRSGKVRTRGRYELYLKACTDVRYGYVKSDCYYFVGVCSDSIEANLYWSSKLLRIKSIEGRERIPQGIFDMMLAPFVRLKRLTIIPYPFKYLREFEQTHGLENFVPEDPDEEDTGKDGPDQWTLDAFVKE